MNTYIALLRGINVGGNSKVEMSRLKKVFESLRYTEVSTYINTGNVIFNSNDTDTKGLASEIEKALKNEFGFDIRLVIRDAMNILNLCKKIPLEWTNNTQQKTDILFLWDKYDSKKSISLIKASEVDTLLYVDGAVVWNIQRVDYKESGMNKFIGTEVYKNMTARNINTVRKLGKLMKK